MSTSSATSRLAGLDTLRALAVTLVVLHHYTVFVTHDDHSFGWVGELGWAGVDLFFALSGYLIGRQIFNATASEAGLSLGRFYARRLLRTLPNFYVVVALYYCVPGFAGTNPLLPVWKFLTFTQNIALQPGTAFSHAWSLCIEEQFYMLLPALALAAAAWRGSIRWAWIALGLLVIGGMLVRWHLWHALVDNQVQSQRNYFKYIYYSTFCRFDELLAGVGLALARQYHPQAWRRLTSHGNVSAAVGVGLLASAGFLFLQDRYALGVTVFGYPVLALGFGLLIVAALSERSLLRSLRVPGAASLALWSYAVYLLHKPVCVLGAVPLGRLGYLPESLVAITVLLAASLLAGWLLFILVETPFMVLRDRFVPSSLAPLRARLEHVKC